MKFDIEKLKNEILKQLPQIHRDHSDKQPETKLEINNTLLQYFLYKEFFESNICKESKTLQVNESNQIQISASKQ